MAAVRRYVFPVIWMLLIGVIAVALAKMAFFPSGEADAGEETITPGAEFDEYALVAAETGDISSTLELSGTVVADEGTPLEATASGEINKIWRHDGDRVTKGERVLQVRYPVEPEPSEDPAEAEDPTADSDDAAADEAPEGPEGTDGTEGTDDGAADAGASDGAAGAPAGGTSVPAPAAPASPEPEYRYVTLVASASGTLTDMEVQEQDELTEGAVVATLSPGTYSIHADLSPEQQLSLLDVELEASATLPTSQDPVTCSDPDIAEDRSGSDQPGSDPSSDPPADEGAIEAPEGDPAPDEGGGSAGDRDPGSGSDPALASLTCPIPRDVKIVAGLEVEVSVALGTRTDVLTVPTTAVEGEAGVGAVYVLDEATGEPAPVEVELGLREDGRVEIISGLEEGQEVLEFAPGVDAPEEDEEIYW